MGAGCQRLKRATSLKRQGTDWRVSAGEAQSRTNREKSLWNEEMSQVEQEKKKVLRGSLYALKVLVDSYALES